MSNATRNHRWLAVVYLFAAVVIFGRVHLPLLQPEETRNADIAREMSAASSWVIPVFEGQPYLDKPPLLYWLVAVSDGLFGPADWSARLPAAFAAWLTVVIVGWWGRQVGGPSVGIWSALVLTLSGDFIYRAPMLTMNGLLALFVTGSLAAGHVALRTSSRWLWPISALLCAAGIMAKGPVAMVLVIPPLVCASWIDSESRRPSWREWLVFVALATIPALPWFLVVASREPGFLEYFFWRHHVERYLKPFDHAKPFWAYLPQLALGLLPWTALLAWIVFQRHRLPVVAKLGFLAAGWGLLFFSVSGSKRPAYVIPMEPAFALAMGVTLAGGVAAKSGSIFNARLLAFICAAAGITICIGVFIWLPQHSARFGRTILPANTMRGGQQ